MPEPHADNPPRFPLTVTDIRQFAYCPRIVYFTYVQPLERPATYKMLHGLSAEDRIQALEKRRKLTRYFIPQGERLFDVPLVAPALGLSGRADMLIATPEAIIPVEFKETDEKPTRNHRLQLTAYAMMAEEHFRLPASYGFIVHLLSDQLYRITCGQTWRHQVMDILRQIRAMIDYERFPDPPKERGKCLDCEFRLFCGDRP